jgi:methylase of polypeptide subunit release factors
LAGGGKVYLEFDSSQKPALAKLLPDFGYQKIEFHRDQYSRWRWVEFST